MQLITKIRLYGRPYTSCCISEEGLIFPDESYYKALGLEPGDSLERHPESGLSRTNRKALCLVSNAYFLKPFLKECQNSDVYRWNVLNNFMELSSERDDGTVCLKLKLEPPDKEIIDYAWNERLLKLVWSRVEIENAFSWLSTLGGAYSALGDYFENCAEEAGRISLRQYKLSLMLGDDGLAARSQLYSAISHAQKGKLKLARHIVRHIAEFAIKTKDKRLLRMCKGVWAKLKYMRSIKNGCKLHLVKGDGDKNFKSNIVTNTTAD